MNGLVMLFAARIVAAGAPPGFTRAWCVLGLALGGAVFVAGT